VPEFVIGLCTEEEDMVLDPFAGSNMTGYVAESMRRRWMAFEIEELYLRGSICRFAEESQGNEREGELMQRSLFDSLPSQE
jgi:site-specific DNA-methyltransferase (cytosine-N4-specific)